MGDQEITASELDSFERDLVALDAVVKRPNIFEILAVEKWEVQHSNMLAWLLDPTASDNIGARFLLKILEQSAFASGRDWSTMKGAIETHATTFRVEREWNFIDILVHSEAARTVLCIENKMDTGEHDDQLPRYKGHVDERFPGYEKLFVYLTPNCRPSSDPNVWVSLGYEHVLCALDEIVKEMAPSEDRAMVKQYADAIRRSVLDMDDELKAKCVEIYRKHHRAIDALNSQINSPVRNTTSSLTIR